MNNEIKLLSKQTDKSEDYCEASSFEELISDLLVECWIKERNKNQKKNINRNLTVGYSGVIEEKTE